MKNIPLTQGKFSLVDDEDFDFLNQWKWHFNNGYAARRSPRDENGKQVCILMHRIVMNAEDGQDVDHINGDRSDNRRSNLRFCNQAENNRNRPKPKNNKSGYKGICWSKADKKWQAYVTINKKTHHLGRFHKLEDAIYAYNQKALEVHGEFAVLNEIDPNFVGSPAPDKHQNNTSGYRGVHFHKRHQKWTATIGIGQSKKHLGAFPTAEAAAAAYNESAIIFHGTKARLNILPLHPQ